MKKAVFILIALLILAILAMAGCTEETTTTSTSAPPTTSTSEPPKPIELRMSWVEANNPLYQISHAKFVQAVHERTGGRVKITEYFTGQLVPPPENYDAVVRGTHDIATAWIGLHPERFRCLEVVQLTKVGTDWTAINPAANELYRTDPGVQAELADTKVLAISCSGNAGIGTVGKQIRTVADIKGLKMASESKVAASLFELLGAAPMTVMPSELYTSLQKKIVDGGNFEPEMLYAINLQEVLKYWTKPAAMANAIYTVMNKDKWNSLPPDIQKIIEDAALEFIPTGYQNHFLDESPLDAAAEKYGLVVTELAPDQVALLWEAQQKVRAEWVAQMEADGLPGQKVMDTWDKLCQK